MSKELESWGNNAIIRMTIDFVHELASDGRGTVGEGLSIQRLTELSNEIDRRKDLGSWNF